MSTFHPHIHEGPPRETITRSLIKTVVYRAFSAADTMLLAWLFIGPLAPYFGGPIAAAAVFGAVDMLWNTIFYFINERIWAHIDLRNGMKKGQPHGSNSHPLKDRSLVQAVQGSRVSVASQRTAGKTSASGF